jgi:hypothetical protein
MSHKRKKVGEIGTGEMLLIAGAGVLVLYLVMSQNKPTATPVVVRTTTPNTGAATTAAEIAAGAGVLNTLINDTTGDDDDN